MRVLLERRVRDLLIVRIVLELARRDRDRGLVGLAVGARAQVGVGDRGGARDVVRQDGLVQLGEERLRRPIVQAEPGALLLDQRREELVGARHVVDEVRHQVQHARLIGTLRPPHPVVRRVAVVERVLTVGEVPRHRGPQNQLGGRDLDGVAEARQRLAVAQVRRELGPDGRPVGRHQPLDHLLDFGRRQRRLVRLPELLPGVGQIGAHRHAGRVIERVVERTDGHVRHADVVDAVRPFPADEVRELGDGARAERLVAGVTGLAADDRVLQVDEPQEQQVIGQALANRLVGRQPEEEAVRLPRVAADRGDHVRLKLLVGRAFLHDRRLVLVPQRRPVAGRRHVHALHRRVAAGIFAEQLVPDIEAGRDVPDALEHREQAILLGHVRHQAHRRPEPQDRVVVVHQRDLSVPHVDVARDLDERSLGRRHHAERVAHRAAVAGDHPEKQIRRARLVALEDGVGEQVERLVLADLIAGQ